MRTTTAQPCMPNLEAHIKRFPRKYRKRLRSLTRDCGHSADLILTFPAALFAIATGYGTKEERSLAIRLIKAGQPLRLIASALGLPYWMRKAPPESLRKELQSFPQCPDIVRKLSGLMPSDEEKIAQWLNYVPFAFQHAPADFALWIAKQKINRRPEDQLPLVELLCVYAWYCENPETYGGELIEKHWCKNQDLFTAALNAAGWYRHLRTWVLYGKNGVNNTWLSSGKAGGFSIVPLMHPLDIQREGKTMKNCVGEYVMDVIREDCRIFSIRHGGRQVATLEIQAHEEHAGMPHIAQLFGPNNTEAEERVWKAVYGWLSKQSSYNIPQRRNPEPDQLVWDEIWKPYREKFGEMKMLPDRVTHGVLEGITSVVGH